MQSILTNIVPMNTSSFVLNDLSVLFLGSSTAGDPVVSGQAEAIPWQCMDSVL